MTITEQNKLIAEFMGAKIKSLPKNRFIPPIIESEFNEDELVAVYPDKSPSRNFDEPPISKLLYHSSWNWLMPVVEKIESTTVLMNVDVNEGLEDFEPEIREEEWQFSVTIENCQCMINQDVLPQYYGTDTDFLKTYDCRNEGRITKLEATYLAVIEFIQWYNENKQQHP